MVHTVSVIPVSGGWAVNARAIAAPMVFFSGAKAEAAARRLAETLAHRGETAEIRIFLRDGSMAGRFVCAHGRAADGELRSASGTARPRLR